MRAAIALVTGALIALSGCGEDDPLSPENLAGTYPLALVNGGSPSEYHAVAAADCTAAFQTGSLIINRDHSFEFQVAYYYHCTTTNAMEGPGTIIVVGDDARIVNGVLYLDGCGPALGTPTACPAWTLDVRPSLPQLTVQFLGAAALFWGDPVFTMGPRE